MTKALAVMSQEEKGNKKMERRDLTLDEGVMMTNLDPRVDFEY
jgi:hypothetical protein